jgi:hypothetical protein
MPFILDDLCMALFGYALLGGGAAAAGVGIAAVRSLSRDEKRAKLHTYVDGMSGSEMRRTLEGLNIQVPNRAGKQYMRQLINEAY